MLRRNYHNAHRRFKRYAPKAIYDTIFKFRMILKYLIAGGTSTSVDILIYSILIYGFGLWYLLSSVVSFSMAFGISFSLQKFWTFKDKTTHKIIKQTSLYFFVAIANLGLSTLLMYFFVDYIHIHKFIAKIFANLIIATESFFVYRYFIFAKNDEVPSEPVVGAKINL